MRYTIRLLMVMLGSLMLVTGFIYLARLFWDWFHDPTKGGIVLLFSGEDGVSSGDYEGKFRLKVLIIFQTKLPFIITTASLFWRGRSQQW